MWKLDRPAQAAEDVFTTCISRVRDPDLKARLAAVTQVVRDASIVFEAAATSTTLHSIARHETVGGIVTGVEMQAVYTARMAKKGAPGRPVYDHLISGAPHGRCPLCGQRMVSTLDHHLPKANFPSLAVAPLNLVPACADCNKAKLASVATQAAQVPLHPYFEDIDEQQWLKAAVEQTTPAAFRFYVEPADNWSEVLAARVRLHFDVLGLGRLYGSHAAEELLNIRHQLVELHALGGADIVRAELEQRAQSCEAARLNGWRTATYQAMAQSEWFCDGGFAGDV